MADDAPWRRPADAPDALDLMAAQLAASAVSPPQKKRDAGQAAERSMDVLAAVSARAAGRSALLQCQGPCAAADGTCGAMILCGRALAHAMESRDAAAPSAAAAARQARTQLAEYGRKAVILDMGCGTGSHVRRLAPTCFGVPCTRQ